MSPSFWTQAIAVARKDLRVEYRSAEVLAVIAPFGAIALMLIPIAIGTDAPLLRRLGPGLYWAVVLLFGMLVTIRQSAIDGPPQRDMAGLLGLDPAAQFAGKALATGLLLTAFEALLLPVALALYDSAIPGWAWLILLVPMVAAALALLGTLVGGIVAAGRGGPALVPLLIAPLAIPVLLAATQALEGLRLGESILGWFLLLALVSLIAAVAGVLTARPLEEAAQ